MLLSKSSVGNSEVQRLLVRLFIGLLFAVFGLFNYCTNVEKNPITDEVQRVSLSPRQEVTLGLQSREKLAAQYGGLYPDPALQNYLDQVGKRVVQQSEASQAAYPFDFHLLNDPKTINAFALPGGQVFITYALLNQLKSEAQLAGALGHEVGHVIARHGSEHLARRQLGAALVNAVGVATTDDQGNGQNTAILAQAVNQLVNLRYGREDELESDRLGLQFMTEAGYNPKGLVELMQILASARSGGQPPEFLSTHPNPGNRVERLQALITETYPNGIPANLEEGKNRFIKVIRSQ